MKFVPYLLIVLGLTATPSISEASDKCAADTDVETRFIPVELMTGSKWDGSEQINLPEVDQAYPVDDYSRGTVHNYDVTLKGPLDWSHPDAGKDIKVYERTVGISGAEERFAIRSDKEAAGRVSDSRWPFTVDTEAKFPLGTWKQGENRSFSHDLFHRGRTVQGDTEIEIEKISCTYKDVKKAFQYRWRAYRRGELRGDYSYIYGPEKGMLAVIVHKSARR